jgi:hypothetical protein
MSEGRDDLIGRWIDRLKTSPEYQEGLRIELANRQSIAPNLAFLDDNSLVAFWSYLDACELVRLDARAFELARGQRSMDMLEAAFGKPFEKFRDVDFRLAMCLLHKWTDEDKQAPTATGFGGAA